MFQARDGEEDWTGVINVAERRRLQTRLNMRAYSELTYPVMELDRQSLRRLPIMGCVVSVSSDI
jgi:hypothetical protein